MNFKNISAVFFSLLFFGFIYFVVQPFFLQKEAVQTVKTVLELWQKKDFLTGINYWMVPERSPSVSGLSSYEIKDKSFGKKDGKISAKITVELVFPSEESLPSGKDWIFEVDDTRYGWKITRFYPSP